MAIYRFVSNYRKSKTKRCKIKAWCSRVILACYKSLVIWLLHSTTVWHLFTVLKEMVPSIMSLLVLLFTFAQPWVLGRPWVGIDLPSPLFALLSQRCAPMLALRFGLGVAWLLPHFWCAPLISDWEIRGIECGGFLAFHVCSLLTCGTLLFSVHHLHAVELYLDAQK